MPPKWQSPLLSPSLPSSSPSRVADTSDSTSGSNEYKVIIPKSGIYGVCFGHPDSPLESTCQCCSTSAAAGTSSSSTGSNAKKRRLPQSESGSVTYCGCECRAEFTSGNDHVSVSLPLPAGKDSIIEETVAVDDTNAIDKITDEQVHDAVAKKWVEGTGSVGRKEHPPFRRTFLTCTRIGRAIYLPRGTRIRVYRTAVSPSCCDDASCQLKWGLVLHREDSAASSCSSRSSEKGGAIIAAAVNINPSETAKKHLICAECGKKFPSVKAIRAHYISTHTDAASAEASPGASAAAASVPAVFDDLPSVLRRPLQVVYNDAAMAVVVKPQGVNVMGARPSLSRSDLFMALKEPRAAIDPTSGTPLSKPVAVHRLDAPTGGLLLVAKTKAAEIELKGCLATRSCHKRYRAIVFGRLGGGVNGSDGNFNDDERPSGVVRVPIDGKPSETRWKVVSYSKCSEPAANGWITTVDLHPITGRKHQLRKHMQALGFPIWGDRTYGPYSKRKDGGQINSRKRRKVIDSDNCVYSDSVMLSAADGDGDLLDTATVAEYPHCRLCLYALEISFPHPVTKQTMIVEMDEPRWYQELREYQENIEIKGKTEAHQLPSRRLGP